MRRQSLRIMSGQDPGAHQKRHCDDEHAYNNAQYAADSGIRCRSDCNHIIDVVFRIIRVYHQLYLGAALGDGENVYRPPYPVVGGNVSAAVFKAVSAVVSAVLVAAAALCLNTYGAYGHRAYGLEGR